MSSEKEPPPLPPPPPKRGVPLCAPSLFPGPPVREEPPKPRGPGGTPLYPPGG